MKIRFKEQIGNLTIYHYKYIDSFHHFTNGKLMLNEDNDEKANEWLNSKVQIKKVSEYPLFEQYHTFTGNISYDRNIRV